MGGDIEGLAGGHRVVAGCPAPPGGEHRLKEYGFSLGIWRDAFAKQGGSGSRHANKLLTCCCMLVRDILDMVWWDTGGRRPPMPHTAACAALAGTVWWWWGRPGSTLLAAPGAMLLRRLGDGGGAPREEVISSSQGSCSASAAVMRLWVRRRVEGGQGVSTRAGKQNAGSECTAVSMRKQGLR